MSDPIINIEGELVALGPMRRDLLPLYQRWINDFRTARNLGFGLFPMTDEAEVKWFEQAATASDPSFTIYERSTGRPIGNTSLHDISWRHRSALFGIMIGETAARGKGYGTETTRLMLDYAFTALGLHSVTLTVYEFNLAGRRAYEKAGFKVVGHRREARYLNGRYWDEILMDCLASEFTSPVLAEVFKPDEPRS